MKAVDPIIWRFRAALEGKEPEEIEELAYLSPAVHFACFVTIKNKQNDTISPVPNILQLRMSEAYETLHSLGVKIRIVVVKPRQTGCSTFASHIVYHFGQKQPIEGITISDDKDNSGELMKKLKDYSSVDSFPWGNSRIPTASNSLEWSNGTKWTIDTAKNPDAGVGGTRQAGHFSEVSKWPQTQTRNDKKAMAAVLPSLSGEGTLAIAESTPERAAGWQYTTWQAAVSLDQFLAMYKEGICPEEQWVKVFAAWFEFPEHRRRNPCSANEIAHVKATLDDRERNGIEKYEWDWEQIAWRREKIASECNGDPRIFDFYYPEDEVSCWLAGGSPRFDMEKLVRMEHRANSAEFETGYLVEQDNGVVSFQPVRDGSGDIYVWERPQEGLAYVVAIDPATDETQTIGADPDRHSVSVWRKGYHDQTSDIWRPAKKVARVRPPFYADGDVVAGHAARLSMWYGWALTAQEVNCGLDILRLLREKGIPLYKRRPVSHRTGEVVEQYGFKLKDQQDRNAVIEGFASAIRENEVDVPCRHSVAEYKLFVVKPNGRAEAAAGAHDDDVMADAMAWEVLPSAGPYRTKPVKQAEPKDRGSRGWRSVNNVRKGSS